MPLPLVIVHGWSDSSASFQKLAAHVKARRGGTVSQISLADYISMSDQVTFRDLAAAMAKAWQVANLPTAPGSVDAIVHSTGGLVIRDWLSSNYSAASAPIKHLVMLAPANFGSSLAHKGRSFMGRVVKGFTSDQGMFQTGTQILKGLELASPYSWNLALRDRFGTGASAYGKGRILCTVLIGNRGYDGISSIANENGADGTVRLSTANLNCAMLDVDFSKNPQKPASALTDSGGQTAFGIAEGHNHATITLNNSRLSERDKALLDTIVAALDVDDPGFDAWCRKLDAQTKKLSQAGARSAATHGFQNTVVRVVDHEGSPVTDYLIEFFEQDDDRDFIAKMFHTSTLVNVHAYSDDPSYRSLYVDCTRLTTLIDKLSEALSISLTAHPVIPAEAPVGFRMFRDGDAGAIVLKPDQIAKVFQPHRTLLVTIKILREREASVFEIKSAAV